MAYLIAIGVHPNNKGGFGSRGSHIWRRGTHVYTEYGPVVIVNHGTKSVHWAAGAPVMDWPPLKMRTVKRAVAEVERRVREKLNGSSGGKPYEKLPRGQKILPHLVRSKKKP